MAMARNPRCQFEIHSLFDKKRIEDAYLWCLENLPLKDDRGIIYWVDELFIITSSQKVIDKVNAHFGSYFSFEDFWENRVFYI